MFLCIIALVIGVTQVNTLQGVLLSMAAYIKSGLGRKFLLSPKLKVFPDEWRAIEMECEQLDEMLDKLRAMHKGKNITMLHQ